MADATAIPADARFYTAQQQIVRQAANTVQAAWSQLDDADPIGSWHDQVRPAAVAAVARGQQQATTLSTDYVAATVAAAGTVSAPLAVLVAGALAGVAAGGLTLAALLDWAWAYYRHALGLGVPPRGARAIGLGKLLTYTGTEVADAGRVATQIDAALRTEIAGYERIVHLPACGRCILLAGRLYRYSTGFLRHPRCDCQMKPVTRDQWRTTNLDNHPDALFFRMSPAQQAKAFGVRDAEAIRAGADIGRVVNARRKGAVYVAGGHQYTHESTTSRGVGRQLGQLSKRHAQPGGRYRVSGIARPTPAQLVDSTRNRDELITQLRRFGYLM
jgi:hypothetical protein